MDVVCGDALIALRQILRAIEPQSRKPARSTALPGAQIPACKLLLLPVDPTVSSLVSQTRRGDY